MTPTEPQPNQPESDDNSLAPKRRDTHTKWVLTAEAFELLLDHFSPNPEEAALLYEKMRVKITRFFEWHSSTLAEKGVDDVFDRVARRISEGETISNLNAYFSSVARLVFMESLREPRLDPLQTDLEIPVLQPDDDQKETSLRCLDECLDRLPIESRNLIMAYYVEEKRAKIDRRKQLADALGIPLNALRIRAHRIRINLEECVLRCIASLGNPRNRITDTSL